MPTEQLFGAYHFMPDAADSPAEASFEFKTLTAPQNARGPEIVWTDFRAADPGRTAEDDAGFSLKLRSDGDPVQAVSEADKGGDFIL